MAVDWPALSTSMDTELDQLRSANAAVDSANSSEVISPVALVKLVACMLDSSGENDTNLTNIYNQLVIVNQNLTTINNTLNAGINVTIVT